MSAPDDERTLPGDAMLLTALLLAYAFTPSTSLSDASPAHVAAPSAAEILPLRPTSADDLTARATASGPMHSAHRRFRWYQDGVLRPDLTAARVPASETRRGQVWSVVIEHGPGAASVSASVSVNNGAPRDTTASVSPATPRALLDDLTCRATAHDPDDDALTWQFDWSVDGMPWAGPVADTIHAGDTVPADVMRAGEVWSCTATPLDAERAAGTPSIAIADPVDPFSVGAVDVYVRPDVWFEPTIPVPGEPIVVHYDGALADHDAVDLRVGLDGLARFEDGMEDIQIPGEMVLSAWTLEMAPDPFGEGWTATFTPPADTRVAQMWFDATSPTAAVDDNDGELYSFDFEFPYAGPYLTWAADAPPESGIVVSWMTSVPCRGVLTWDDGETQHIAVDDVIAQRHQVRLTGLEPDADYSYRVYDVTGRVSPEYTFHTARPDQDDYTFIVISDMQDSGRSDDRWPEVADAAFQLAPGAAFAVMPGDLAGHDLPSIWWRFFANARDLLGQVPIVPAIGNHDTPLSTSNADASSFRRWFPMDYDGTGDHHATRFGRTHILSLDSEVTSDFSAGSQQDLWIIDQLTPYYGGVDPDVDWVFTQFHVPAYTGGDRFADSRWRYEPLTDWFDGAVDWTFQAHEHIGQRFVPIRDGAPAPSGAYGNGPDDGVGYYVTPSAGAPLFFDAVAPGEEGSEMRELLAFPALDEDSVELTSEYGFATVDIHGRTMTLTTWGMGSDPAAIHDPTALDTLTYTKP